MKHTILLAVISLAGIATASAQDVPVLDLDNCLSIALTESPTIKVADLEVKRVDYSRKEVIGQLLPLSLIHI